MRLKASFCGIRDKKRERVCDVNENIFKGWKFNHDNGNPLDFLK